ncbi:COG1361 S-layer family protein [Laedolimicola sp.]|uniref:COG1361 S-layer family protein n=1 Tax=Laedolimicola sp. TaxID=2981663 RepID=UPI003F7D8097
MKNKVLKKALVLMMCGALAVPAAGMAQPMVAHATAGTPAVQAEPTGGAGAGVTTGKEKTPAEQLADAKKNALDQLADYYDALKDSVSADKKADFDKAKKDAETVISNMRTSEQVTAYLAKATAKLDTFVSSADTGDTTPDTTPTTTNNNIMVGGNWVTPVANAGQQVNVVLPVVNMGRTRVKNVVVTPAISEDAAKWPFEIETSNYSQTIDRLPGTDDGGTDMERRRELTWTLKTRKDAPSGYMPISFNVTFENDDKSLSNVTLTSYVKVVGTTGISADGKSSTPRVIVTGFSTDPETVHAGDTFTLTLHMQNTSKATAVKNMVFDIQAASESTDTTYVAASFLPTAGSSTVFVDKIAAGANKDISIELEARSDLAQKPYVINVKMDYEDENVNAYENTASVSIPVRQEARIDTSSIEVTPQSIEVGGEANVSFSLYNIGKTKLYNASVKFVADSVTGGDTYLGNIDPGATGSVDAYLTGAAATTDDGKVKIQITFEDESGEATTIEKEMELYVTEMMNYDDGMTDDGMYDDGSQSQGGFKIWYVLIPLVIVIAVVAAFLIIRKKKAKKAAALLEADDLDDLEDVDLGDDTEETDDAADTSEDGKEKE